MPVFVQMERTHGSLIAALQRTTNNQQPATPIFTTIRSGLGTLIDRLVAAIPPQWIRLNTTVTAIEPSSNLTPHSFQRNQPLYLAALATSPGGSLVSPVTSGDVNRARFPEFTSNVSDTC